MTNQYVEDVALMHVDGDQGLEFGSFDFGQIFGGLVDKSV